MFLPSHLNSGRNFFWYMQFHWHHSNKKFTGQKLHLMIQVLFLDQTSPRVPKLALLNHPQITLKRASTIHCFFYGYVGIVDTVLHNGLQNFFRSYIFNLNVTQILEWKYKYFHSWKYSSISGLFLYSVFTLKLKIKCKGLLSSLYQCQGGHLGKKNIIVVCPLLSNVSWQWRLPGTSQVN